MVQWCNDGGCSWLCEASGPAAGGSLAAFSARAGEQAGGALAAAATISPASALAARRRRSERGPAL